MKPNKLFPIFIIMLMLSSIIGNAYVQESGGTLVYPKGYGDPDNDKWLASSFLNKLQSIITPFSIMDSSGCYTDAAEVGDYYCKSGETLTDGYCYRQLCAAQTTAMKLKIRPIDVTGNYVGGESSTFVDAGKCGKVQIKEGTKLRILFYECTGATTVPACTGDWVAKGCNTDTLKSYSDDAGNICQLTTVYKERTCDNSQKQKICSPKSGSNLYDALPGCEPKTCPQRYVWNEVLNGCTKEICGEGLTMMSGKCVCIPGMKLVDGKCVQGEIIPKPPVLEISGTPGICGAGLTVLSGKCICPPGEKSVDGKCVKGQIVHIKSIVLNQNKLNDYTYKDWISATCESSSECFIPDNKTVACKSVATLIKEKHIIFGSATDDLLGLKGIYDEGKSSLGRGIKYASGGLITCGAGVAVLTATGVGSLPAAPLAVFCGGIALASSVYGAAGGVEDTWWSWNVVETATHFFQYFFEDSICERDPTSEGCKEKIKLCVSYNADEVNTGEVKDILKGWFNDFVSGIVDISGLSTGEVAAGLIVALLLVFIFRK